MRTFRNLAVLIGLLPMASLAAVAVWEPLTKETFVGSWEAVMPIESTMVAGLYRMDIHSEGDSYLIGLIARPNEAPWERFVLRLSKSEVNDGKVRLRFQGKYEGKDVEVLFDGSGAGLSDQGAIGGKFSQSNGKRFDGYGAEIWFRKGAWTRDFERISKEAERMIGSLRSETKKDR